MRECHSSQVPLALITHEFHPLVSLCCLPMHPYKPKRTKRGDRLDQLWKEVVSALWVPLPHRHNGSDGVSNPTVAHSVPVHREGGQKVGVGEEVALFLGEEIAEDDVIAHADPTAPPVGV